jgi:hypothetical protein
VTPRTCLTALLALGLAGCTHREPPSPEGSASVAPLASAASAPAPGSASASASGSASASAPDPASLPQTRDRPQSSGPAFDARAAALWNAIVRDDPDLAMPFFFPLGAYQQVKDIGDPASDWKHRLVAAYARDVHALHRRLGDDPSAAKLVALDVPDDHARWVDPGEEYNKLGYFRVFGSKLRCQVDGKERAFDVKSLISWRGEWYVVHLSAIK